MTVEKRATWGVHYWGGELRDGDTHASLPSPRGSSCTWSYPQASGSEWDEAWDALERPSEAAELGAAERWRRMRGVARELESLAFEAADVGEYLGLEPDEWRAHRAGWREALEREWRTRDWRTTRRDVVVVRAHWTDGVGGLLGRVAAAWIEGARVLLLSDERLPQAADLLVQAWLRRAAEGGADLAVLHRARLDDLERAAERSSCRGIELVGTDRELALPAVARLREDSRVEARELTNAEAHVAADDDLEARAREVIDGAFGRGTTLGGQLPGQIARVHCEARAFSRFSEHVLATLESEDMGRPVPCIDRAAADDHREACHRGLDQGATLVSGGTEHFGGVGEGSRDRPLLRPALLTNVEPDMDLARWRRPTAVLSLLRAPVGRATAALHRTLAER